MKLLFWSTLLVWALAITCRAQVEIQTATTCAELVTCDTPVDLPGLGAGHKYGDFIPECWNPSVKDQTFPVYSIGQCLKSTTAFQTVFQISEVKTIIPPPAPGFFATRRFSDPPIRTNRQTLRSKWFLLPHAAGLLATTADVLRNRHNCRDVNVPCPGIYADAYVPFAAVTAFDYVSDRFFWRPLNVGAIGYLTVHHLKGAITGRYH